jgi:hypothetical protein
MTMLFLAQAQESVADLSSSSMFWWGALGGAIATLVVYVLPGVILLATTGSYGGNMTPARVAGIVVLVLFLSALGGAGPFLASTRPTGTGDAIKLGIGALAAIKALLAAADDAAGG